MKIKILIEKRWLRRSATAVLVVAAFIAGALWRGSDTTESPGHGRGEKTSDDSPTRAPQMYTCSMHPQVRSPDPDDKCPICAMDLIPVPADDDDGDDGDDVPRLRLSARAAALMDIRTWPAERRKVELEIRLFGKVGYDESLVYDVVARTETYIERLFVNTPWQPVTQSEVLAEFHSPEVFAAMRELLVASERPEAGGVPGEDNRRVMLEAARARLIRRGVSATQIDEIVASGVIPRTFRVESPVDGVAQPINVRAGEWLREGGRLARIADLSRVWVNLEAYERDLPWLAVGLPVNFDIAAHPGKTFAGRIIFIDPVVNESSRTIRLRVEAENTGGLLKPGMLVSAGVHAAYPGDGNPESEVSDRGDNMLAHSDSAHPVSILPLVIPVTAPLITGRRALVYVRVPGFDRPVFEPRTVVLGPRAGNYYIVREGIEEGELVVVNGQFKIDSELQIRGRPGMMTAAGGSRPAHDHGHDPVQHAGHTLESHGSRLQTHCPVMGGPINRDLYHDHAGQRIYVCCPGCLDEVRERAAEIIEDQRKKGIVFEKITQ